MLIALLIEEVLADQECSIVGPYANLADALAAARVETFDLAVLDVNLAGEMVYPVAELLAGRQIPFILLSGYGKNALPADRQDWVVCNKPFEIDKLVRMLELLVRDAL